MLNPIGYLVKEPEYFWALLAIVYQSFYMIGFLHLIGVACTDFLCDWLKLVKNGCVFHSILRHARFLQLIEDLLFSPYAKGGYPFLRLTKWKCVVFILFVTEKRYGNISPTFGVAW